MSLLDSPDEQPTRFISGTSGDLHQTGVSPKSLSQLKVDAVFALVLGALIRVVFETHGVLATRRPVYLRYIYYTVNQRLSQLQGVRLDQNVQPFRHLSPSFAPKRNFLAVDLTVSPACFDEKCFNFNCLYVPETIEWE